VGIGFLDIIFIVEKEKNIFGSLCDIYWINLELFGDLLIEDLIFFGFE